MSPRIKGAALLILSFGLGCVAGATAFKLMSDRTAYWRGPDRGERFEKAVLGRLTRELDLRTDQQQQVETVLRDSAQEFRRLRDEIGPRFGDLRRRGEERIRAVLDQEQRAKFAELVRRWERRIERWHGRDSGSEGGERRRP